MAELVRMTLKQIIAASVEPKDGSTWEGQVNRARVAATTEEDIHRHQVEDGEDPGAPFPDYRPVPDVQAIRERLRMSQEAFARLIQVPVATVRNWEQRRTGIAPAARTLLRILEREPDAALRALTA